MKQTNRRPTGSGPDVRAVILLACSRQRLLQTTALQAAAVASILPFLMTAASAQPAPNAAPRGGTIIAGQVSISQTATQTTVNQASQRAIANWQSFDVGSQQTVQFQQPSSSAVILNRVVGPNPSEIAGRIQANGQVVLVNQAGVVFDKGAQVNTAGLVVSAAGISNSNFMAGGPMVFDQPAKPDARVVNNGTLTIQQRGLAALVAPQVANAGVIKARLGTVVMAGAETATLDLYGDGLLSINVTRQVHTAPDGTQALVTNTGSIAAAGGTVVLTAEAVDGVVQTLVNTSGRISAATVGSRTGQVIIAGRGGDVEVEGSVSAKGRSPGETGGSVAVNTTGMVTLGATARISVSGQAGGGTVAIGTTLARAKGGPAVTGQSTATGVVVRSGAVVHANATVKGNGGRVTVLSDKTTTMNGSITAKGGPQGGNGGFVEVSGGGLGMLTGGIDVSAPNGLLGSILLDPFDLDIVASGANDASKTASGVPVTSPDQATSITVSGSVLTGLNGNLLIEASHNLTIDTPLSFTHQAAGNSVTFLAGNNMTVNQPVSTAGGALTLSAAVATDGTNTFTNFNAAGSLTVNAVLGSALTPGAITLTAGTGGIILANTINATTLDLNATGGGVNQTGGVIAAATLQSSLGVTGTVSLLNSNTITTLGSFAVAGDGNFLLNDTTPLTVAGTVSTTGGSEVWLDAPTLTIGSAGFINAGDIANLETDSFTLQNGGSIATTTLLFSPATAGGAIVLGASSTGVLSLPSMSGISVGYIVVGGAALPGNTTSYGLRGGSVSINGAFDVAQNIFLVAQGTVSQTAPLTVGSELGIFSTGNVTLLNPSNAIGTIAALGAGTTGNYQLTDSLPLTVNTGSATGDIYLKSPHITVTAALSAGGTLGLQTDTLTLNSGVSASIVELAPGTSNTPISLGGISDYLPSLANITAGTVRIGAVT
ncbi:MAG TPA: filamentous hemagglutinin N-terminal domain-containing protein, partial [Rhodopila sp.]|nr:filamentous hemagglutinin N-terminal domain-containing protein [Rhodopila sp.]